MIEKTVLEYSQELKKIGIEHEILEHPELKTPPEVVGHLGLTLADSLPTLIMKADNEFIAVVRRGSTQLDFKLLKKVLKINNLRLATLEEFVTLTTLSVGAARVYNPGLKTFIDKNVFEVEYLVGGSGSFTSSIKYKTEDLKKIPHNTIISVAQQKSEKGKRILTGDTPTGKLHLGHYVGTLENRVKLQDDYETFIILADVHAFTTLHPNPSIVRQHTLDVLLDNLAVGLDPKKVTVFVESEVPELYELAALFSMYVSHNRALRNPTIKDEIKMKGLSDQFSLGFVNYPIYQAADILCVKGEFVPVGQDQEAHLEQSREIARVFNKLARRQIFPEPKALIGRVGKLVGTDGNSKMSKTLGNTIYLSESKEEIEKKVMNMYTDPTRLKATDPGHVEGNPVFAYLDAFGLEEDKEQIEKYKEAYTKGQVGDVEVKKYLVKVLNTFLEPIRERRKQYNNEETLLEIIRKGNQKAREETQQTLKELKEVLRLIY